MQAVGSQEISQPGMGYEVNACFLSQSGHLPRNSQPAASSQVGLHDVDAAATNEPLEVPHCGQLFASCQWSGALAAHARIVIEQLRMNEILNPADAKRSQSLAKVKVVVERTWLPRSFPAGGIPPRIDH